MTKLTPPYPIPERGPVGLFRRMAKAWRGSLALVRAEHYEMKMGSLRLPGLNIFVVNETALVKDILTRAKDAFPKSTLVEKALFPLVRDGVFVANGKTWEKHRQMIDPAFDQRSLKELFPLMKDAANDMVARLNQLDDGIELHVDREMTRGAADVIIRTMFSKPISKSASDEIFEAFDAYQRLVPGFLLFQYIPVVRRFGFRRKALEASGEKIRRLLIALIKPRFQARNDTTYFDILQAFMDARDDKTNDQFSFDEIVNEVAVMFLAGHETSAGTMALAMYLIAHDRKLQDRLFDELEQVTGGSEIEFSHLSKLTLLRNVLRETLRLYPPIGYFYRQASKPCEFRGKPVPKDSIVVVSPWIIQRHKDQWACPHAFDPDRYGTPEGIASMRKSYIPFNKGPRVCPGAGFAMQEMALFMALMVRHFKFDTIDGFKIDLAARLTLRSRTGVKIRIEKR